MAVVTMLAVAAWHTGAARAGTPLPLLHDASGQRYVFSIDEDALHGPPDVSDLNRPLTPADRLVATNGHFYSVGADGEPGTEDDQRVRLFGVNLSFAANFPSQDDAPRLARRLRKLGFNAVRLHHLDTFPSQASDPPHSILVPGRYPTFNPVAVDRLRAFINALAAEGIYINLNLRVGYIFDPEADGVPPYERSKQTRPIGAPMLVYHPQMIEQQKRYATELFHRLGLKGHPGLAMVEINNESALLAAWQRREWLDAIPQAYRPILSDLWQQWLVDRYGSIGKACSAWGTCSADNAVPLLTLSDADVSESAASRLMARASVRARRMLNDMVSRDDVTASEPRASGRERRTRDFLLFLAHVDARYFEQLRQTVHAESDEWVPVTGTQMGYGGVLNLTSHEQMDYLDHHFYIDHPHFINGHSDVYNWRMWNASLTGKHMDMLLGLSFLRDHRKPLVISEFNQPFPNSQGAEILPVVAAVAALQDWDGLFFFDYANASTWPDAPSGFTLSGDWGKYVVAGQAAQLFRKGWVEPAAEQLRMPLSTEIQAAIAAEGTVDGLNNYIEAHYGVVPAAAWQRRIAVATGTSQMANARAGAMRPSATAGHQIRYASEDRMLQIQTPRLWALLGQLGQAPYGDGLFSIDYPGRGPNYPSVILSSLDAQEIPASRRLLLTLGSATVGTQPGSMPPRPKEIVWHPAGGGSWTLEPDPTHATRPSGSRHAQGPAWLTRNELKVTFATDARGLDVYPLDGTGARRPALPPERIVRAKGTATLHLQASPDETSPWYEVVASDDTDPSSDPTRDARQTASRVGAAVHDRASQ